MTVYKFGGASVKDAQGVRNLLKIVESSSPTPTVLVASAMGKSTNLLEKIADSAWNDEDHKPLVDEFISSHEHICKDLFGHTPAPISHWMIKLSEQLSVKPAVYDEYYDSIVSYGELVSTSIIYLFLKETLACEWIDARQSIRTDSNYREAEVDWAGSRQGLLQNIQTSSSKIHIIQGFIGADQHGKTTTLGREGSDFTGAIVATIIKADSLTVWKDVPGLLNADPRLYPDAKLFDEISYQETTELTYYGARVIHPKTTSPLAQAGIPLYVKSFIDPASPGTKITNSSKQTTLASYVFKPDQLLLTIRVTDNSFMDEPKLIKIMSTMHRLRVKANMVHISALTFSCCTDEHTRKLQQLIAALDSFDIRYNEGLHLDTVKHYTPEALLQLPRALEIIMEQKSRHDYQRLYKPISTL